MRRLSTTAALLALTLVALMPRAGVAEAQARTCGSFPSQAAAQQAYRADPVGLRNLDADRDGIACESNRCPCDTVPVTPGQPVDPPPAPAPQPAPTPVAVTGWQTVERVVDGDTIDIAGGVRVRLYGIDAPEAGDHCGPEATAALTAWLAGGSVYLEAGPRPIDRFGRALAYAYVVVDEAWMMVDGELVTAGAALAWRDDGQHRDQLVAAEDAAMAGAVGCLWGG